MLETGSAEISKSFRQRELSGGGGGSRTRVRKHIVKEIYMRIRFWVLVSSVRKRPKPPDTRLGVSHLRTPSRRSEASLFNDVRPPTTRRGRGERSHAYLIKQRERTDCPQLTDVPSDLRVNGARHASRDSVPPSKPNSPPSVGQSRTMDCTGSVSPPLVRMHR